MSPAPGPLPPLDAILKAHATKGPDRLALVDPPDCEAVTGMAPRRFTYREADRAVGAIAARLREIGLAAGSVVGIQMPNVAAGILTLLAVMRAGMIAAPLPLLFRRADCVAGLSTAGARAIVTCGRVSGFDHAGLALEIATELFPIRAICGFGCGAVDGVVPLDDLLSANEEHPDTILFHGDRPAAFAVITFDTTIDGIVPMARSTAQLLAGGRLIRQRGAIAPASAVVLSTLPVSSCAGIATTLVPWLLTGGTLVLHHPFDPDILREQIMREHCTMLVVPDAMLPALDASDWLDNVSAVISVWRAPERLAHAAAWTSAITLVDAVAFGETAMLAARRPPDGRTLPWPIGPMAIADGGSECAQVSMMPGGTLGIRGPLAAVSFHPYGTEASSDPGAAHDPVDTGYPCRAVDDGAALVVTAPPAGMIRVGGYGFAIQQLQHLVRGLDANGVLAALPHARSGHRLAGHSHDPVAMRAMLRESGSNPLLPAAFRDHTT
ncbi:MAG: AMP-binding protein [Pseudorhodoplanes sp.]|uniref:AMP-binding protein n=1 Tax=Pseudorhodoplanes sp. TaxID=1934341 RepID=UPI003D0CD449